MRKQLAKIALAASIALALAFTLSCGDHSLDDWFQEDNPSSSSSAGGYSSSDLDVFAVDISQETEEWNYMVVAKDGSSMFIDVDESNDIPTRMFLKPDKNSDKGFSLFFKEDGLPDKMVVDGNILYFGNFTGYKYDLAIIYPDNRIEYHYGIETDVDWDAYRMTPKAMLLRLNSGLFSKITKSIISVAVPAVTCGAVVFFPNPITAAACASGVFELVADIAVETVFDGFTEDVGKALVDIMFCANGSYLSCVSGLYDSASLLSYIDFNLTVEKTTQINEASRKLDGDVIKSSSSIQSSIIYGTPVYYEGETYETVVIGSQTWFKRNLNYPAAGSKCGNGFNLSEANTAYCDAYGRLYDWATAMSICPSGWHIPSNAEWTTLENFVGSSAGKKLKATSGWGEGGNGTDNFGFSALPGSYGGSTGFEVLTNAGFWWSANAGGSNAYFRRIRYDQEYVYQGDWSKGYFLSVRCLQDSK